MYEIRVHGRGGQGAVTAAEVLSVAAFLDGAEAQAFPSFGSERMGAPVAAYCRIGRKRIRVREPVSEPDAVVILDPTLVHHVDVFAGLKPGGHVVINSNKTPTELGISDLDETIPGVTVITIPASEIARTYLGKAQPNICMLGALAALSGIVTEDSLRTAVRLRFAGAVADNNILALDAAFAAADTARATSHV